MNDANPPTAELNLTAQDIGTKPVEITPSKLSLAQANGRFYNSLIDVYLTKDITGNRQEHVTNLVKELPQHARGLYEKGLQIFEGELRENHALIEQHRGDEAKYLIGCVVSSEGREQAKIDEILSHITPDQARFVEPTEGVGIIQVEHELYDYLTQNKVINLGSEAIHFGGVTKGQPDFVIVRRHRLNKGLDDKSILPSENTSLRHEFHHLIWNFIERGKFLREPQETTPELSKAFGNFRNELAAYIIDGRNLTEIDLYAMTYTGDKDIQKIAGNSKALAYVCMELARSKGIDLSTFLYPAMTSRGFKELNTNILELTPVDEQVQANTVNTIYDMWGKKDMLLPNIKAVLKAKKSTISPIVMKEVALTRLANFEVNSTLRDLQYIANDLAQFSETLTTESLSANSLLIQTLSGKLPFPDETIVNILNLPQQIRDAIPITDNPEKFIRSFVSMWRVEDEAFRTAYSQLINTSPEMRKTFDKLKDELIAKDGDIIKRDFGYESGDDDKKTKIDDDVQRKADLLRSL